MTLSLSVISYIIEFLIALSCLSDMMYEKLKKRYVYLIGAALYGFALAAFVLIENILVNMVVFISINFLFAFLCFEATAKQAILYSLFLTAAMGISEFLFMVGYAVTGNGDIVAYSSSLAAYTISVVLSKTLYFVLTKLVIYFGFSFRSKNSTPPPAFA